MKSIGLLVTPFFTRLMTKGEFGYFNNFQAWLMIMLYICSLDLEGSIIRAVYDYKKELEKYVYSIIILGMMSTVLAWILSLCFRSFCIKAFSIDSIYIDYMFVYLLFCPAVNVFQSIERFKYKYKWTVACGLFISVGASLLSLLLVALMQNKLQGRIVGFILPTIILGVAISFYYFIKARSFSFSYWKYALPITLPYIPHLLSMYLLSNMDRVMIMKFCGSEQVALYSLAYTCGMVITMLSMSINNAYSPWLAEKLSQKDYDSIRKSSTIYVLFFSFAAFGVALITPELLYILGGKSYISAKSVMPPVMAGCMLQFVYCMYVNIEQYEKRTIGMACASAVAAGLNFLLNYIFIRKYGYISAAYTTYTCYFFLLIIHVIYVKKIGRGFVYKNNQILSIGLLTSVLLCLIGLIFDFILIRYFIVAVYIIIGFVLFCKNTSLIKNLSIKEK